MKSDVMSSKLQKAMMCLKKQTASLFCKIKKCHEECESPGNANKIAILNRSNTEQEKIRLQLFFK